MLSAETSWSNMRRGAQRTVTEIANSPPPSLWRPVGRERLFCTGPSTFRVPAGDPQSDAVPRPRASRIEGGEGGIGKRTRCGGCGGFIGSGRAASRPRTSRMLSEGSCSSALHPSTCGSRTPAPLPEESTCIIFATFFLPPPLVLLLLRKDMRIFFEE